MFCSKAKEYRPRSWRPSENADFFNLFKTWLTDGTCNSISFDNKYDDCAIQFIKYPNFLSADKDKRITRYFIFRNSNFFEIEDIENRLNGNSFMNFNCQCACCGEGNGWFYEINLFVVSGFSAHHLSTKKGKNYSRENSEDGSILPNKGLHWSYPDGPST